MMVDEGEQVANGNLKEAFNAARKMFNNKCVRYMHEKSVLILDRQKNSLDTVGELKQMQLSAKLVLII